MKCKNWPIGVCSWSLRTDVDGVADAMKKIGIDHVHLGVRPGLEEKAEQFLAAVQKQQWTVSATMIDFPQEDYSTLDSIKVTGGVGPDEYWERNQELFLGATDLTVQLGVKYLSMHAGFIDESDAAYAEKFYERVRSLADAAGEKNIILLLETGQETAEELRHFLQELDHPAIGVNFDPANMILYDKGNPIEAIKVLAPWVKHIHIKDATRTKTPGTWGAEVPWGNGEVQTEAFLNTLAEIGYEGTLAIEREAGDDRFGDVKLAAERLSSVG
ncbi:MAG: sugar phosphate isomerase/epimerase [Phycisphaerales bacterium]|nr:MAG: sugar phosphate isomerase/epimerase [Phycisphaerales bacterium]